MADGEVGKPSDVRDTKEKLQGQTKVTEGDNKSEGDEEVGGQSEETKVVGKSENCKGIGEETVAMETEQQTDHMVQPEA